MRNILTFIGLLLIIAGAVVGTFAGIPAAQWIELSGFAVGLALCIVSIVKATAKKDWKLYSSLAAVSVGTILLVWAGLSESVIQSVIGAVIGLVALLAGLLPSLLAKPDKKERSL
jgi:uncharacterized membrane protein HdeD (DUF308 family)